MASALKRKNLHAQAAQIALVDAADEAVAASDLLTLLCWAGVGMGQDLAAYGWGNMAAIWKSVGQ